MVPTRDRPEALSACLESIARQNFPRGRFEVIVVDDGSREPAGSRIRGTDFPFTLLLLRLEGLGPAAARNAGAAAARGECVAFTDDDCRPGPGWLSALSGCLSARPGAAVAGPTLNGLDHCVFSEASQHIVDRLFDHPRTRGGGPRLFVTSNAAMPLSKFRRLGGFDTRFPAAAGEDRELCSRWIQAGLPIRSCPGAKVRHFHRLDLRAFLRQHIGYGRAAFLFLSILRSRSEKPDRRGWLSFYPKLVSSALQRPDRSKALVLTALVLLSQAATAAGFLAEALRSRRPSPAAKEAF